MKKILARYPIFTVGLYLLSLGIVLIIRSALGTTPISSLNYVLSLNTALSLGTCTFILNIFLIAGQFWLILRNVFKKENTGDYIAVAIFICFLCIYRL